MANAIVAVFVILFFLVLFTMDDIKDIVSRRTDAKLKCEVEVTKQKQLELEIVKATTRNSTHTLQEQ